MSQTHEKIDQVAAVVSASARIVVSSGAGVSRESGILTFRESDGSGFWGQYNSEQLATLEGFLADPQLVWNWYAQRRKDVSEAEPNPGHLALAQLEKIIPEFNLITQNVDGLHQRAGSRKVIELHGNINRVKCLKCDYIEQNWTDNSDEIKYEQNREATQNKKIPPPCPQCSSMLRPDIVWFGEPLSEKILDRAFELAANCDLMLVVGTSGQVQPAASLPIIAKKSGAYVVEINTRESELSAVVDVLLQGPSGEVLPEIFKLTQDILNLKHC